MSCVAGFCYGVIYTYRKGCKLEGIFPKGLRTEYLIPMLSNLRIRILWSNVSKADDKSSRISMVGVFIRGIYIDMDGYIFASKKYNI